MKPKKAKTMCIINNHQEVSVKLRNKVGLMNIKKESLKIKGLDLYISLINILLVKKFKLKKEKSIDLILFLFLKKICLSLIN